MEKLLQLLMTREIFSFSIKIPLIFKKSTRFAYMKQGSKLEIFNGIEMEKKYFLLAKTVRSTR